MTIQDRTPSMSTQNVVQGVHPRQAPAELDGAAAVTNGSPAILLQMPVECILSTNHRSSVSVLDAGSVQVSAHTNSSGAWCPVGAPKALGPRLRI